MAFLSSSLFFSHLCTPRVFINIFIFSFFSSFFLYLFFTRQTANWSRGVIDVSDEIKMDHNDCGDNCATDEHPIQTYNIYIFSLSHAQRRMIKCRGGESPRSQIQRVTGGGERQKKYVEESTDTKNNVTHRRIAQKESREGRQRELKKCNDFWMTLLEDLV